MKILFILPEFYPGQGGGIITFYQNLIRALRPYCEKIKVIVGSGYTQDNYSSVWNDVEVEYLQPERYQRHLKKFSRFNFIPLFKSNIAAAWAIFEQANGGQGFDIVECNDFGIGYLPWVLMQLIPVIVRLHGSIGQVNYHDPIPNENLAGDFFRQAELLTLPLANDLQTHSNTNQQFWEANLKKSVNILLPVFTTPLTNPSVSMPNRLNYGLVTGRLQYWKGPLTIAKALKKDNSSLIIHWYGRNMTYNQSKSMMSDYLSENFSEIWQKTLLYKQRLPLQEIGALQRQVKYGIVPSVWDMFNMSCIEFMAAGTPLICSDGAGAHDLLEDGINGYIFKANDEDELLDKMRRVNSLTDGAYSKMSSNAYETARSFLNEKVLIPIYISAYQNVIKTFKPAKISSFLISSYQPDRQKQDINDLLDQQPLSKLLPYLKSRLSRKTHLK